LLLVGAIAITKATLLNVVERRPEIGLRGALGATRHHITRQIALEASITGTITGALAGIPPAIKAARTPPADTLRGQHLPRGRTRRHR